MERDQARVVIIDSLNGYLNATPHSGYLTAQLHELLSYLNNKGVATFLVVAQSGLMGRNMLSPIDAGYLADTVVALRYFEHAGMVKKAISVLKKRTGAHEESIRETKVHAYVAQCSANRRSRPSATISAQRAVEGSTAGGGCAADRRSA